MIPEPRTPFEWLAERAIASLLVYDAHVGHGAHSWAGAVEAFVGILRSCPYCGDVDPRLASVYRDGGSMVYHYGCPVGGPAWKNPDFPWPTPEQIAANMTAIQRIARAESGELPPPSPSRGFGLPQMASTPLRPKAIILSKEAKAAYNAALARAQGRSPWRL